MKTRKASLAVIFSTSLLILLVAAAAFALPFTPGSYERMKGAKTFAETATVKVKSAGITKERLSPVLKRLEGSSSKKRKVISSLPPYLGDLSGIGDPPLPESGISPKGDILPLDETHPLEDTRPLEAMEAMESTRPMRALPEIDLRDFESTSPAAVPEPGTLVLLGAGLFGLAVYSKRRMSRS